MTTYRIASVFFFIFLASCQSKPLYESSQAHRSIHPELDIGEYSVRLNEKEILTFSRGQKEPTGLLKMNIENGNIEIIDGNAKAGKDLALESSWLYYRIEDSIYRRPFGTGVDAQTLVQKISSGVEKLKAVTIVNEFEYLLLKKEKVGDFLICRKGDSSEYVSHTIPQQGVAMRALENGNVLLLIENTSGLYLAEAGCLTGFGRSVLVEARAQSNYAKFFEDESGAWLAYLQEEKGTLQMLSFEIKNLEILENLPVAGKAFESYVGMDIAFFSDGKKPGVLFLNGQNLKLHWSRYKNQAWREEPIKLTGAVGFYNTVLKRNKNLLTITTHAFRAINSENDYSFEDLLVMDLDLR